MPSLRGTKLFFFALAGVAGLAIALGIMQERSGRGTAPPPRTGPPPSPPEREQSALKPSPGDPSASELLKNLCGSESVSCECRREAVNYALSRSLNSVAAELFEKEACTKELRDSGLQAEALAWNGALDEAQRSADLVLLENPKSPYATFAVALIHFRNERMKFAEETAVRALDFGRGAPAQALMGILALRKGETKAAAAAFDAALKLDPMNVEARYNRAVLAEQAGTYNVARQGYLKTLSSRPGHADSRYALARLTFAAGAVDEARHHLRKLVEIAPDDPRIEPLSLRMRGEQSSDGIQGTIGKSP